MTDINLQAPPAAGELAEPATADQAASDCNRPSAGQENFTEPTADEMERQVRWELDAADRGIRRYREQQTNTAEIGLTNAGQRVVETVIRPLADHLRDTQEALVGVPTSGTQTWYVYLCAIEPEQLAYLILRTITSAAPQEKTTGGARNLKEVSKDLARRVQLQIAYEDWIAEDRAAAKEARLLGRAYQRQFEAFRRKTQNADARSVKRWFGKLQRAWKQPWQERQIFAFGYACVKWAVDHGGGLFELRDIPLRGGKIERFVALTDRGQEFMSDHDARAEIARPLDRPMLCRPRAWRYDPPQPCCEPDDAKAGQHVNGGRYVGGYYLLDRPLLRSGLNGHTAELERPISDETLAAINSIQSTPWRINTAILDMLRQAWRHNQIIGEDMPRPNDEPMPPRVPDALWATMSKEERADIKAKREAVYDRNAKAEGQRFAWLARIDIAADVAEEPAIWFPHFVDFRGRLYPMTAELNPQGNDPAKALLMFARGKPLGEDGLRWLCIRAANCWGMDKRPLAERVDWVMRHRDAVRRSSAAPLQALWWSDAKEPWSFLATCFELAEAFEQGPAFISHLPVPLDGSCNGLQHLAAMGRDRIGAMATNVVPGNTRRDIYSEVADLVKLKVAADAGRGAAQAKDWVGHVTRQTVKRAVMTTPYGVTARGMQDQLLEKGHANHVSQAERGAAVRYLRTALQPAIQQAVPAAYHIMAWLRAIAEALAERNIPFRWTTPTGNTLQASYWEPAQKRVNTLAGRIQIEVEDKALGLNVRKQVHSIVPHIVHSFDSAHLCRTVNACVGAGLDSFAMIHDSFGTHAADTSVLARVLRVEFVRLYRDNLLQRIEDDVSSYAGDVQIPSWRQYVTLGALDVQAVLDAEFFFA